MAALTGSAPSPAIARLLAAARAAGDEPTVERGADGTAYRFARAMPPTVREAGLDEPGMDYLRSAEGDDPEEGFLDPETDTWLFFPVDPAHNPLGPLVDEVARERARSSLPARLMLAGGTGAVLFALVQGAEENMPELVLGGLMLVAAFGLRRRV